MCAAWSKIEGYAPRLALVIHLVKWANGEIPPDQENLIDADSMQAGRYSARPAPPATLSSRARKKSR